MRVLGLAACLVAAVASAAAAQASDAPDATITVAACTPVDKVTETRAQKLLDTVDAAVRRERFAGIERHLPEINQALADAPPQLNRIEDCDGQYIIREDNALPWLMLVAAATSEKRLPAREAVARRNAYGQLALYLGAFYVEHGDFGRAIPVLRRGLTLAPGDVGLSSELANALASTGASEEALAVVEAALARPFLLPEDQALLLRRRGFALGELKRYDEGIAAYRQSLTLVPNHATALNEIAYLEGQKAGAPQTKVVQVTVDKSATFKPTAAPPPK